jgi:hypothetical protein
MGFALTLLYVLTVYLSPSVVFGELAESRIELILASATMLVSIPAIWKSGVLWSPQTIGIAGMSFAVAASIAVTGWLGGAAAVLYGFLPVVFAFYFVAANCTTKLRLQILVLALFAASVFTIAMGVLAVRKGEVGTYLLIQGNGMMVDGIPRIRGVEFLNDPNDFAQLLVSLIPCLFLYWKRDNKVWGAIAVLIPASVLLTGMYYTHSRGGAVALMAVIVVAARRKVGTVPAVLAGGLIFLAALAVGWSGGRDVSTDAGDDRLSLWYAGMQMFKTHPLFGVGVGNFADFGGGHTAHNSVMVCVAEAGFVGLLFWVAFLFAALRGGILLGREPKAVSEPEDGFGHLKVFPGKALQTEPDFGLVYAAKKASPEVQSLTPGSAGRWHPVFEDEPSGISDEEIRRMARLLVTALAGFLAAGWFLSRALSFWLFMYAGMMYAVLKMGRDRGLLPPPDSIGYMMKWSVGMAVGLIAAVEVLLRVTGH